MVKKILLALVGLTSFLTQSLFANPILVSQIQSNYFPFGSVYEAASSLGLQENFVVASHVLVGDQEFGAKPSIHLFSTDENFDDVVARFSLMGGIFQETNRAEELLKRDSFDFGGALLNHPHLGGLSLSDYRLSIGVLNKWKIFVSNYTYDDVNMSWISKTSVKFFGDPILISTHESGPSVNNDFPSGSLSQVDGQICMEDPAKSSIECSTCIEDSLTGDYHCEFYKSDNNFSTLVTYDYNPFLRGFFNFVVIENGFSVSMEVFYDSLTLQYRFQEYDSLSQTYKDVMIFSCTEASDTCFTCHECFDPIITQAPAPSFYCGNGVLESGEQCDDGNLSDWDGCTSNCVTEPPENTCSICREGGTNDTCYCCSGEPGNGSIGCGFTFFNDGGNNQHLFDVSYNCDPDGREITNISVTKDGVLLDQECGLTADGLLYCEVEGQSILLTEGDVVADPLICQYDGSHSEEYEDPGEWLDLDTGVLCVGDPMNPIDAECAVCTEDTTTTLSSCLLVEENNGSTSEIQYTFDSTTKSFQNIVITDDGVPISATLSFESNQNSYILIEAGDPEEYVFQCGTNPSEPNLCVMIPPFMFPPEFNQSTAP
jgi:cysteine-rich repeat protein